MANPELKSVPRLTGEVPTPIARILAPMIDAIERRFLSRTTERAVTREDLVRLGLTTRDELRQLDR